jgi:hypothetical protein
VSSWVASTGYDEDSEDYVYLVEVRYKSGHMVSLWFQHFEYEREANGNTSCNWKLADPKERIIGINVGDIESIVQVDVMHKDEFYGESEST